jgi:hypothetical protein
MNRHIILTALSMCVLLAGCSASASVSTEPAASTEPTIEMVAEQETAAIDPLAIYFPTPNDAQPEVTTMGDVSIQTDSTHAVYSTTMNNDELVAFIRSEYEAQGYINGEAISGNGEVVWNVSFPTTAQALTDQHRFLDVFVANPDSTGRSLVRIGVTTFTP